MNTIDDFITRYPGIDAAECRCDHECECECECGLYPWITQDYCAYCLKNKECLCAETCQGHG